jgi:peptide methionine sulfoxide reductase msrA/msrB
MKIEKEWCFMVNNNEAKTATFAGGCFWCMIPPFQKLEGVNEVIAGYIGGKIKNPTYREVCSGLTGHYEVVQVSYNPSKISYSKLLDTFWRQIDPTDEGGQFYDRGGQYKTAIFYYDEEQKKLALESRRELESEQRFHKKIATEILEASEFYPAEEYHQDYHIKNPDHYNSYKVGSGREAFIHEAWGDSYGKSER